jgi:hypothetical protein
LKDREEGEEAEGEEEEEEEEEGGGRVAISAVLPPLSPLKRGASFRA